MSRVLVGYSGCTLPMGGVELPDLKNSVIDRARSRPFLSRSKNLTAVIECAFSGSVI